MTDRRPVAIRKSDLTPAFEAAKAAGFDQVSVVVETAEGHRFHITAGNGSDPSDANMSPLEKWRAGRAS